MENQEKLEFPGITLYITNACSVKGCASIQRTELGCAIYLKEEDTISENPFKDETFILTPLTQPYISKDGHHIFDLSFYSELTLIDEPPRLCFNDPTQEKGISLNFSSKTRFQEFFAFIKCSFTIVSPGLPGFFSITRFRPQLCPMSFISNKKMILDDLMKVQSLDQNELLNAHTKIISKVVPKHTKYHTLSETEQASDITNAFTSLDEMRKLIRSYIIPPDLKSDIWAYLIKIYPLNDLPKSIVTQYSQVKSQWISVTQSQYTRASVLKEVFLLITKKVNQSRKEFEDISSIPLEVHFNVIMALIQVYHFLSNHFEELAKVYQIFEWLFIKEFRVKEDKSLEIRVNKDTWVNQDQLETILFWSMINMLEVGELRRLFEIEDNHKEKITEQIEDYILMIHPQLYKLITKESSGIDSLSTLLTTCFRLILPPDQCSDILVFGMASNSMLEFNQNYVTACLFFTLPTLLETSKRDTPLIEKIEQTNKLLGQTYVANSSLILIENLSDFDQMIPMLKT